MPEFSGLPEMTAHYRKILALVISRASEMVLTETVNIEDMLVVTSLLYSISNPQNVARSLCTDATLSAEWRGAIVEATSSTIALERPLREMRLILDISEKKTSSLAAN